MTRIFTLTAAISLLSLASCAHYGKKGGSCCSVEKKDKKECCSTAAKDKKDKKDCTSCCDSTDAKAKKKA